MVLSGSVLFGTAAFGGSSGNGTVFAVNTDGTSFADLHVFTAGSGYYPNVTNSDGANPNAGLTLSGNTLYGTASDGGDSGNGIVFAINADGTGFTNPYIFTPTSGPSSSSGLESDPNQHSAPEWTVPLTPPWHEPTPILPRASGAVASYCIRTGKEGTNWAGPLPQSLLEHTSFRRGRPMPPGSLCNPPRTLFHPSGPTFLRGRSSSMGRTP